MGLIGQVLCGDCLVCVYRHLEELAALALDLVQEAVQLLGLRRSRALSLLTRRLLGVRHDLCGLVLG
mgnify:CR=1 FL=1